MRVSYKRTTKDSVEYIANKFAENPGHFAATILRMYWDMEKQRDQFKTERDTLIDDIAVLKANISRLERENEKLVWTLKNKEDVIDWNCLKMRGLKEDVEKYKRGIINLANEKTKQLKQDLLRSEELQDEIIQLEKDFENKHNLLSEISQHIGNKPSSSTYKYFRAKLDGVGIKEGE